MNRTARLSIAAAATFVAVLAAKIWTYASGQDSATYMEIARGMQQWVREEPVLTHHLKLVAPVYPALLAVMRELGGPLVAYWVNPVICVVWLVLAAQLAARCAGRERLVPPVMLMTASAAFLGNSLFPHFALYPFRSPLMLALMFAGFLLVHRAARLRSITALVGGWLVLLLAALTREFALIGWICCGIWWWGEVRVPKALRLTGTALFLGPILLGALSAPLWILSSGSEQIHVFVTYILRRALEQGSSFLWNNFAGICFGLFQALGPIGLLCLLLGFWHTRRNRAVRWLIIVPGLFLAFAYTPFLVHQRYVQESLAFLAILSGIGLGRACEALRLRCAPPWQRIAPWLVQSAVLLFCIVPPLLAASPVFGRVTAREIRLFLEKLPPEVKDGHAAVINNVEGRLWEVIQANTRLTCINATQVPLPVPGSPPALHYLESKDGKGWSPKKWLRERSGYAALQDHYDLKPWSETFTLGGVEYHGWTCLIRRETTASADIPLETGTDHLLFLDLGGNPTQGRIRILDDADGDISAPYTLKEARGWTVLQLPPSRTGSRHVRVSLEADAPVPADLNAIVGERGKPVELTLGVMRLASSMALFDPASRAPAAALCGVLLKDRGVFTPPVMPSGAHELEVSFGLRRADTSSWQLDAGLFLDGEKIGSVPLPPRGRGDVWLVGRLPVNDQRPSLLEIKIIPGVDQQSVPVWVTSVRFQLAPR